MYNNLEKLLYIANNYTYHRSGQTIEFSCCLYGLANRPDKARYTSKHPKFKQTLPVFTAGDPINLAATSIFCITFTDGDFLYLYLDKICFINNR